MSIKCALISVYDKANIVEFAQGLASKNIQIISTGGTAKLLIDNNITVTEVADYTGEEEMMGGRVKTLHSKIHAGILARRGIDETLLKTKNIKPIDLVVVNLYPFAATVAKPDCTLAAAIENIDIGGPAMLRSAAKNHTCVTVLVDSADYQIVLDEINNKNDTKAATRAKLAQKAFAHTAQYDGEIAHYLHQQKDEFRHTLNLQFNKTEALRYGENPHQKAALYLQPNFSQTSVATSVQVQGKQMSFNNMVDADAALECVRGFAEAACVIVKHANPCGVAVRENILAAYQAAFTTDPTSAFGGIIAFNRLLDENTAQAIIDKQFVEVIIAPDISKNAKMILSSKQNLRVLVCGNLQKSHPELDFKRISGGLLVQDKDLGEINANQLKCVTRLAPTKTQISDLLFAWKVAKAVKSNAIVYAKNQATLGIGAGQMSRLYSAKIATLKAADEGLILPGCVLASDAFFPFRDSVDIAGKAGIKAIIEPGGSNRDDEVIAAADEHGIAMVFTAMRHFKH